MLRSGEYAFLRKQDIAELLEKVDTMERNIEEVLESRAAQRILVASMAEENDNLRGMVTVLDASVNRVTAERDEARRDAERWQADALRLMNERNAAEDERDSARREVCARASSEQALLCLPQSVPEQVAEARGWDCFRFRRDSGRALDRLAELDEETGQ